MSRAAAWLARLGVAALAIAAAVQLDRIAGADPGFPLWDPAEHGLAGAEIVHALTRADLAGALLAVNRQVLWPFTHSLLLAFWMLPFGSDYASAARLSAALFAGTVVALFAAGAGLHPTRGAWVGAAAAVLALLSPIGRLFGSVCMLEMPGAFFLALTACLHARACREPAPRTTLVWAGVTSAALFFCKYNYGLLWLAALGAYEWLETPPARRSDLVARARAWLGSRRWLAPFPIVLSLLALTSAVIAATGGGVITIGGARISARSPGNPLYAFYLAALAWAALAVRRAGGWRAVAARLSPRHRILVATVALPIAVWFLIPSPNRFRTLFDFVVNRDTGQPLFSLATWLDYPRAFAHDYSPAPWVGWLVLALALVPPRPGREERDPGRLLHLALWVGLLATALHRYHQPRFLFTVAPLVWLCAAQRVVAWLDALGARAMPARLREPAWGLGLVALLAWGALGAPPAGATIAARRSLETPAAFAPVLDRVLDLAERSERRPWMLGYSNVLSPALIRWHALITRPTLGRARQPQHPPALDPVADDAAIARRIEAMRAPGRRVLAALAVRRFPADDEYRRETRADSLTEARLVADPGVVLEFEEREEAAGFRVSAYRFRSPDPAPAAAVRR